MIVVAKRVDGWILVAIRENYPANTTNTGLHFLDD